MSKVTLYGGPFDGKEVGWEGGDVIRLSEPAKFVSVTARTPLDELTTKVDYVEYRRSLRSPHIFVFQP